MYSLGIDLGSSFIKVALVDLSTGQTVQLVHTPDTELEMISLAPGWAEQDPEIWWSYTSSAIQKILTET